MVMSPKATKSRNLDYYHHFLKYDDPSDIPFAELAEELDIHPNRLRGMIRPARRNSTIYAALNKRGHSDNQIPAWFARPDEPLVYRKAASAGPRVSAAKRSDAEASSLPHVGDTVHTYVAQEKSAQRSSALSARSAPPAGGYSLVQPEYRSPLDPVIEEALRQIQEIQNENLRDSLEWRKRRRDPPKPDSPDVIKAKMEAFNIMQHIEARNASQTMYWINMSKVGRAPERIGIEEIADLFIRPVEEMQMKNEGHDKEQRETFTAVGKLFTDCIPRTGPTDDFIQRFEAAIQKKEKSEREAFYGIEKILSESLKYKNFEIQLMENQTKNIWDNFWETTSRAW